LIVACGGIAIIAWSTRSHGRMVTVPRFRVTGVSSALISIIAIGRCARRAGAFLTAFITIAGILVSAGGPIGLGGVRTFAAGGVASSGKMTFIRGGADDRRSVAAVSSLAGLIAVAGVLVIGALGSIVFVHGDAGSLLADIVPTFILILRARVII
jgi:hypothetical protein